MRRRRRLLLIAFLLGALCAAGFRVLRLELESGPGGLRVAQVVGLETVGWQQADNGWLAIASPGIPRINESFAGGPLSIAGAVYRQGLGTYPQSEISYKLDPAYTRFESEVGVDDKTPAGRGHSRFLVFGDDRKLYDSGVMRSGDRAKHVRLFLSDVEELRLVTVDESPDGEPGFTNWAGPRLARGFFIEAIGSRVRQVLANRMGRAVAAATGPTEREIDYLARLAAAEFEALNPLLTGEGGGSGEVQGIHDEARARYVLANDRLVVSVGYGGEAHGTFSVFDRNHETVLMTGAASGVTAADGRRLNLARDSEPAAAEPPVFTPIEDPVFGSGTGLSAGFRMADGVLAWLDLALYQDGSYLVYQLEVSDGTPASFELLDDRHSLLALGSSGAYLTDYGRLRHVRVRPDGLEHKDYVGEGKPLFIWSAEPVPRSVVIAALDETNGPPRAEVQLPPRRTTARVGFTTLPLAGGVLRRAQDERGVSRSPRLYLEFASTVNPIQALANFRRVTAGLYPPPPLPDWFRYQWNSWYTYYMEISDEELYRQGNYIEDNLRDLGPWNIAIDAGWNISQGREGGDWRAIDYEKFPEGMRTVVDSLRDRDIRTILYFSAPYLDNRRGDGNWLGLAGVIEQHPEWLIKVDSDDKGEGYLYDFSHPGFRSYMRTVLEDFFVAYGVDGIELDGLGTVPMPLDTPQMRDVFGVVPEAGRQTMDIYRFIHQETMALNPNAYIYAGWHFPLFSNPYSHAFWYSDELPAFSNPYPYGGLAEHVDYSIVQQGMWGQRSVTGFAYGDPNHDAIPRWLLEASIALGTQVSLGFDLPSMTNQTLSAYRARLVHYRPHEGEMFTAGPFPPSVFGSHRRGMTYLGLMNRETEPQEIEAKLADIGLDPATEYLVYSVEDGKYSRVRGAIRTVLPPASFRLYLLKAGPGVVWTNSSYDVEVEPREIRVNVRGPEAVPGFIDIATPPVRVVFVDGEPVPLGRRSVAGYDRVNQVLRVRYSHDREHEIRVVLR